MFKMKKLIFFPLFLFSCVISHGQIFHTTDISLNVMSYPTMPLEHQKYNLKIEGLGAVSEYGVTYEGIEKIFSKTVKMIYTKENNYDYTLKIIFGTPSLKNDGIQSTTGSVVRFYGAATCNIPVYTSLVNKDGLEITEKHLASEPIKIRGEECFTQADASKNWNGYLKNSNKVLSDNMNEAIKSALWDFQSKHDVFSYPKKVDFIWAKANKRFNEEGWEKNVETLKNIQLQMLPGQSLMDYKDTIIKIINFYEDQYNWTVKNKGKGLIKSSAASNGSYLCMLLPDFERMEKFQELLAEWKILNYISRDQDEYAKVYTEKYNTYMTGHTVDAECIALLKLKHLKDSLATKPSNVKIYFKDNRIIETQAFVNIYRPGTIVNNGNIIDLSFGQILELVENNTTNVYKRLLSSDLNKVEAGDEVFYPVKYSGNNKPLFAYLLFESPKIRVMQFKSDLLLQKTGDEEAENFNSIFFGTLNKKLAKYFVDCPELAQKLSSKEIKIEKLEDIINVAKKYSDLK
jgi:hypothetical protein